MDISIFELYSIGIGPSSSHTVGPMRAAKQFIDEMDCGDVDKVVVDLYGSLALTGKGHGTNTAVMLGLSGQSPESIDPKHGEKIVAEIEHDNKLSLNAEHLIDFNPSECVVFNMQITLDLHANGMKFTAFSKSNIVSEVTYFSIGGGFILSEDQMRKSEGLMDMNNKVPYPFESAAELFKQCRHHKLSISEVMFSNERVNRSAEDINNGILEIWRVMNDSIKNGFTSKLSKLPGGLNVRRRASKLYTKLKAMNAPSNDLNWLNAYAIAVNEENAAGGRVVTAPTNGAAGIIPAILKYYLSTSPSASDQEIIDYLLTTAAIGMLYKKGASISAAEVGCQGEVGVAASMAAGGLCYLWGGTLSQVEVAAEIAMEHSLGLTCDPIGGLVQIPCIERNAMGSSQAVNSARLALIEDGGHKISLDNVIKTMKETGRDMSHRYKETSLGGLAVNVPAC
ncbi:MAG: L-serine dehydratase [Francisellaceae bacterium]|jgi:L-serine dehydratase